MGNWFSMLPFMKFCASWNSAFPFIGDAIYGATQQTGYFPMWSAPQWGPDYNFTLPYSKENASAYMTNWSTFEGFESGKVKISIYATGYSDDIDMCKIYVEQIKGVNAQEYGLDKFTVK